MDSRFDVPFLKQVPIASPAVGTDWRHICPGQGIQRIVAIRALFTAAAVAVTRLPALVLSDGSDDYASVPANAGVTTGLATLFSTFPGAVGAGVAAGPQLWSAPTDGWLLLPGWSLRTVTAAIDAGDQWSAIRIWLAEYPTGPEVRITPDVHTFTEPKG